MTLITCLVPVIGIWILLFVRPSIIVIVVVIQIPFNYYIHIMRWRSKKSLILSVVVLPRRQVYPAQRAYRLIFEPLLYTCRMETMSEIRWLNLILPHVTRQSNNKILFIVLSSADTTTIKRNLVLLFIVFIKFLFEVTLKPRNPSALLEILLDIEAEDVCNARTERHKENYVENQLRVNKET
jgi:hypothetical protein